MLDYYLEGVEGVDIRGRRFPLISGQTLRAGHALGSDIGLPSLAVGRWQFDIGCDAGGAWFQESDSRGGTWINRRRAMALVKYRLRLDDVIRVADSVLRLTAKVSVDPLWLTWGDGTVRKVAEGISDDLAFDRLPILADALEEAGCADAAILEHCRRHDPQARDCWVIDLLVRGGRGP